MPPKPGESAAKKTNTPAKVSNKGSMELSTIVEMFERMFQQLKQDHTELITMLSEKFESKVQTLTDANMDLQCKMAVLQERLGSSQLKMLQHEEKAAAATTTSTYADKLKLNQNRSPASNSNSPVAKPKRFIQGTGDSCKTSAIKSAPVRPRPVQVFVSRLDPNTTAAQIRTHVNECFELTLQESEVEQLTAKYPSSYSSFVIKTTSDMLNIFLDGCKWPENALVRKYFPPRSPQPSSDPQTSQNSADSSPLNGTDTQTKS